MARRSSASAAFGAGERPNTIFGLRDRSGCSRLLIRLDIALARFAARQRNHLVRAGSRRLTLDLVQLPLALVDTRFVVARAAAQHASELYDRNDRDDERNERQKIDFAIHTWLNSRLGLCAVRSAGHRSRGWAATRERSPRHTFI